MRQKTCYICGGRGNVLVWHQDTLVDHRHCFRCKGTGRIRGMGRTKQVLLYVTIIMNIFLWLSVLGVFDGK